MSRYLSERRPIRPGGDILRSASGASHSTTDFRDCECGAKFGRETSGRYRRVMPATVAPAKDVDARLQNFAELGGAPPRIFRLDVSALVLAHIGVPAIRDLWLSIGGQNRTKKEHCARPIIPKEHAERAGGCSVSRNWSRVKVRTIGGDGKSVFRAASCRRSIGRLLWSRFVGFCADR